MNAYFYIGCDLQYCRALYDTYIRYYNNCMFIITSHPSIPEYFKGYKKVNIIEDKGFQLKYLDSLLNVFSETETKIALFEVDEIALEVNIGKLLKKLYPFLINDSRIVYKYNGYDENFIFFTKNEFAEFYQTKIDKMEINSNSKFIELLINKE